MGKNHRHKKDLKAEKAKTKLKQSKTKFLPKGLNVTNTAFKIKPIVLPEQLKDKSSDDILSKRKLNVKDLLSRIRHYNENMRNAACEELSDMIKVYTEEIVQQHLSAVCLAVSSLMQDREKKVRKAAFKAVEVILDNVPSEKLIPFFDFFSTNLRCAMTNIDKNIQEDSLLFLDCFIKNDCGLITKSSQKLLPDFLSLISKLRSDSQLGRTLTLNLGSKMTSVTWRIKVLSRLHAVLNIILEEKDFVANSDNYDEDMENVYDASTSGTFPIYKQDMLRRFQEPLLDIFCTSKAATYCGLDTINRHIVTLIPLLYETWLEVMPEQKVQKSTSESTVLSAEMAALLTCITNTLYLLWQYVKKIENEDINLKTVFMSSEGQKFLNHLLSNFPYCSQGTRAKGSKNGTLKILEHNNDPKCVHENLLICFLYLVLHVNCSQHNLKRGTVPIISYITKLFFQKGALDDVSTHCLMELLAECFGKNSQKWHKSGVDLQMILENAIMFYDHGRINDQNRLKVFQVLSNIIDNAHLSRNAKYQNWLSTLPNTLCQPSVTDITISGLLELSKKNCSAFHAALVRKLPEILENLNRLQITVTSDSLLQNEERAKMNFANIFYYVPTYSASDLQVFQNFIRKSDCNLREYSFRKYFREILKEKF